MQISWYFHLDPSLSLSVFKLSLVCSSSAGYIHPCVWYINRELFVLTVSFVCYIMTWSFSHLVWCVHPHHCFISVVCFNTELMSSVNPRLGVLILNLICTVWAYRDDPESSSNIQNSLLLSLTQMPVTCPELFLSLHIGSETIQVQCLLIRER
jgi:hypothetical protein